MVVGIKQTSKSDQHGHGDRQSLPAASTLYSENGSSVTQTSRER